MIDDKKAFFEKYKDCGSKSALEKIWKAKENQLKELDLDSQDPCPSKSYKKASIQDGFSQ
jgi:hypothetical protein